jgi:hypothetical protein
VQVGETPVIEGGNETVTVTPLETTESRTDVAVIITVPGPLGVKTPVLEIDPPEEGDIDQVTLEL